MRSSRNREHENIREHRQNLKYGAVRRMNTSVRLRIGELSARRADLKAAKNYTGAIPLQLAIIELLDDHSGLQADLANAHNYVSGLYLFCALFHAAEHHARAALTLSSGATVKDLEARGCYNRVLAQILAAQYRFEEALPFAEDAVRDYSAFHNPPDEYLSQVSAEAEQIRNRTWSPPPPENGTDASPQ